LQALPSRLLSFCTPSISNVLTASYVVSKLHGADRQQETLRRRHK
jgi:hypothetical protein